MSDLISKQEVLAKLNEMILGHQPAKLVREIHRIDELQHAIKAIEAMPCGDDKLVEALTPSGETKAAYIGEFSFDIDLRDENGEEYSQKVIVPWTTTKEIMAAILAYSGIIDKGAR